MYSHNQEVASSPDLSFYEAIEPFLVAVQWVPGISPPPATAEAAAPYGRRTSGGGSHSPVGLGIQSGHLEQQRPLRTVKDVARALHCTPEHLSRVAHDRGYSYSRAVRWVVQMLEESLAR